MKHHASPFFTPRIERPLAPGSVNPLELSQWLSRQKRANQGYFKENNVKNKIKKLIKKHLPTNSSEKFTLGECYSGHKVYLDLPKNRLPKLKFKGYVLDFNHYLNEQAYTCSMNEDSLKSDALSPCGRFFLITFKYKNSDWNKILVFDLKTRHFINLPIAKHFISDLYFCWTWASELVISYIKPQAFYKKEKGTEVFLCSLHEQQSKRYKKLFSLKKAIPAHLYYEENENYKGVYIIAEDTYSSTIYYKDLKSNKKAELVKSFAFEKAAVLLILEGNVFYTENSSSKNNGQVSCLNLYTGEKTIVSPEYSNLVLNNVEIFYNNYLVVSYLDKNLKNHVKIFNLKGNLLFSKKFQEYGDISFWEDDTHEDTIHIELSNFEGTFCFEINAAKKQIKKKSTIKSALWAKVTTKFGHYSSFDGEKIPYFLIEPKIKNPATMLYAYGSFSDHTLPDGANSLLSLFLELGGTLMMPCIRGGGERGYYWNKWGSGTNKIKSIRDYISAAEFLFKRKYAQPESLIAHGISGGGLVVAAALNFKPEYFKAALPFVGLMDMLNYQKYSSSDNWHKEYGKIEHRSVYSAIARYCPVNKVKRQNYPSILAITGSHDARVAPIHTYKFVDKVQRFNEGENPILLENVKNHGHFAYDEPKALAKTVLFLVKELKLNI